METTSATRTPAGSGPRHRHQPIDMLHLQRQTLGDKGLEGEVLRLFDQMAHIYLGRLEDSTSVDELLRHLHSLRGAAVGVGAQTVAELARVAEDELRAGAAVDPERIDDLGIAVQECSAFIGALLETQAA